MLNNILYLALVIIPLAIPLNLPFMPNIPDLWQTKDFLSIMFTLAIILLGPKTKENNPWLISLVLFYPISIYSSPPIQIQYGHENIGGAWLWREFAWVLLYYAFSTSLRAMKIEGEEVAKAIGWTGVITAIYAILQSLGLDQWQATRDFQEIGWTIKSVNVVANIGNPRYCAIFLGLCLPFSVLYMRWWCSAAIGIAILMCQSHFGTYGMALTLALMFCLFRGMKWLYGFLIACIISIALLVGFWSKIESHIPWDGRNSIWEQTFEDWPKPCIHLPVTDDMGEDRKKQVELLNKRNYVFTGRGPGSFNAIFATKHETKFNFAHNEYLQALYEIGLFGAFLLIMALGWHFWKAFSIPLNRFRIACICSGFFSCVCAIGFPIWHFEPLRFYSVVALSLL